MVFIILDVSVDFEHGSYTFSERDLQSFGISLMLSTTIAQPLTVVVGGGKNIYMIFFITYYY